MAMVAFYLVLGATLAIWVAWLLGLTEQGCAP